MVFIAVSDAKSLRQGERSRTYVPSGQVDLQNGSLHTLLRESSIESASGACGFSAC
jgi:hypothetical protein